MRKPDRTGICADDVDEVPAQADLFLGLADGGELRTFIAVDLAAWKGDLARMLAQGVLALGEDDMGLVILDDADQHRGIAKLHARNG